MPDVLKNVYYRRLFIACTISQLGTSLSLMAMMAKFLALNGSASGWPYVMLVQALPFVLLSWYWGNLVDRSRHRLVLGITDFSRFIVMIMLASCNQLGMFFLCVFLSAIFLAGYEPARRSIVTLLLTKEQLLAANSLEETARGVAMLVGVIAASFLLKHIGVGGCFLIDALSFLISASIFSMTRFPRFEQQKPIASNMFTELQESWRIFRSQRVIWWPAFLFLCVGLLVAYEAPLFFPMTAEKGWDAALITAFMTAAVATGSLMTGLFLAFQKKIVLQKHLMLIVMLLDAITLIVIILTTHRVLAVVFNLFLGMTETVFRTYSISTIQKNVSPNYAGRLFAGIGMVQGPVKVIAIAVSALSESGSSAGIALGGAAAFEFLIVGFGVAEILRRGAKRRAAEKPH